MAKGKVKKEKKRFATHITTPEGKRVYLSAASQKELDMKVAQAKIEIGAGVNIADNTLFTDYVDLWLRTYKAPPKMRQNSYDTLKSLVDKNIIPYFEGKKVRDIKPIHIQAFIASISRYCYDVQSRIIGVLRSIFLTAEDNGLILKSPVRSCDKPTGEKSKGRTALTNEQANQLLEVTKGTQAYLFCLIALSTGMRRSEILGLMWEDVDLDAGYITVTHSKTFSSSEAESKVSTRLKSAAAHRRLPIPDLLLQTLKEERAKSESEFVVPGPDGKSHCHPTYYEMWKVVDRRTEREGFPLGKTYTGRNGMSHTVSLDFKCHPHLLRHTYITQCFESGMDIKQVQYLAGHSTPGMTLGVYTHYRQKSREQETADKVFAATSYLKGATETA